MTISPSDTDGGGYYDDDDDKHWLLVVLLMLLAFFFSMQKLSEPGHMWFKYFSIPSAVVCSWTATLSQEGYHDS